ncbi:MAG: hypothetical protein ACK55Z_35660 [bacterium]
MSFTKVSNYKHVVGYCEHRVAPVGKEVKKVFRGECEKYHCIAGCNNR